MAGEPTLTADLIEKDRRVDLAFLIRRVVNHIHDLRLRWVLRYGVIPSNLTLEFLSEVLAGPLQDELWKRTRDDAHKGLPMSLEQTGPFRRISEGSDPQAETGAPLDLSVLWEALKQYASSASWVREEGKALIFTPDVLEPMRGLLLEQEKHVFLPLHRRAFDYFVAKAEAAAKSGQDALPWYRQAVFHDFQHRGEDAGKLCAPWSRRTSRPCGGRHWPRK